MSLLSFLLPSLLSMKRACTFSFSCDDVIWAHRGLDLLPLMLWGWLISRCCSLRVILNEIAQNEDWENRSSHLFMVIFRYHCFRTWRTRERERQEMLTWTGRFPYCSVRIGFI